MSKVTLCIMALNDAYLLDCCLGYHKPFFDEVIVLDGMSQDNSVEVAKKHGTKVFQKAFSGSYGDDQNYLMSLAETPWVLFADCDEFFEVKLLQNIHEYVKEDSSLRLPSVVAFQFPRKNIDEPDTWPDFQTRLFLKDKCEWQGEVDDIVVDRETGKPICSLVFNPKKCQTLTEFPIIHIPRPLESTRKTQERWKELRVIKERNRIKKVLIASLVADQEPWLPQFLQCLDRLDYPRHAMRHAFVEAKNIPLLHQWAKPDTWIKEANPPLVDRLERLAYLRNIVVEEAHPMLEEDYVLWIDSDIIAFPPTLIKDLMKHDAPVVGPAVWIEDTQPEQFYDTFAFRTIQGQNVPALNLPYKGFTEMSSVGTCYLVASRLYSQSKIRYRGGGVNSEQVIFCAEVRKLGEQVYADFNIKILHANLPKYGKIWH